MNKDIVLYMHAGSGNHGCEAIVNSTCHMLSAQPVVISTRPEEDRQYSLKNLCTILPEKKITEKFLTHLFYFIKKQITRNSMCYIRYRFGEMLNQKHYKTAISIGGDNYCYPEQVEDLILLNKVLNEQGSKTILWGVSIEPELLQREDIRMDMKRYAYIFARERVTFQALIQAGIAKNQVFLYPDPAFCLETVEKLLPKGFEDNNTVGINISPMIIGKEGKAGITLQNYEELISYILEHTDMQVALIPHVIWENNDDRKPLKMLYDLFGNNKRVIMLEDCGCMELKGWIKHMRFLVAARTHASIAAYSSQVPTLVVGYSVKAEGIAKELFGTWEHYVIPVQHLDSKKDLTEEFVWLLEHEQEIRKKLKDTVPAYIEQAKEGGRKLKEVSGV